MVKTIQIEDKELTLSNNLAWATIYKDQFGHDIVPDIMPILSAILRIFTESGQYTNPKEMLKGMEYGTIQDALLDLCSLQFVDLINLVWALAKAHDEDIEAPSKWIRQFDTFPLDIIAPAVLELMARGLISSKNFESLQRAIPKEA